MPMDKTNSANDSQEQLAETLGIIPLHSTAGRVDVALHVCFLRNGVPLRKLTIFTDIFYRKTRFD